MPLHGFETALTKRKQSVPSLCGVAKPAWAKAAKANGALEMWLAVEMLSSNWEANRVETVEMLKRLCTAGAYRRIRAKLNRLVQMRASNFVKELCHTQIPNNPESKSYSTFLKALLECHAAKGIYRLHMIE